MIVKGLEMKNVFSLIFERFQRSKYMVSILLFCFLGCSIQGMDRLPPHERDRPIQNNVGRTEPNSNSLESPSVPRNPRSANRTLPENLHSLVYYSVNQGEREIVRICRKIRLLVIIRGIDIDILNESGHTALYYAVRVPEPSAVLIEALLWLGADAQKIEYNAVAHKLSQEIQDLMRTHKKGSDEAFAQIRESFMKKQQEDQQQARQNAISQAKCLADAIAVGEPALVRQFLLNEQPTEDMLSLFFIELGKKQGEEELGRCWEILFDLIAKNRSLLLKRREDGKTVLFDAVATRSRDRVEQLLNLVEDERLLGEFINIRDSRQLSALNYAVQFGAEDIVELLRSRGGNEAAPNAQRVAGNVVNVPVAPNNARPWAELGMVNVPDPVPVRIHRVPLDVERERNARLMAEQRPHPAPDRIHRFGELVPAEHEPDHLGRAWFVEPGPDPVPVPAAEGAVREASPIDGLRGDTSSFSFVKPNTVRNWAMVAALGLGGFLLFRYFFQSKTRENRAENIHGDDAQEENENLVAT